MPKSGQISPNQSSLYLPESTPAREIPFCQTNPASPASKPMSPRLDKKNLPVAIKPPTPIKLIQAKQLVVSPPRAFPKLAIDREPASFLKQFKVDLSQPSPICLQIPASASDSNILVKTRKIKVTSPSKLHVPAVNNFTAGMT